MNIGRIRIIAMKSTQFEHIRDRSEVKIRRLVAVVSRFLGVQELPRLIFSCEIGAAVAMPAERANHRPTLPEHSRAPISAPMATHTGLPSPLRTGRPQHACTAAGGGQTRRTPGRHGIVIVCCCVVEVRFIGMSHGPSRRGCRMIRFRCCDRFHPSRLPVCLAIQRNSVVLVFEARGGMIVV